MNVFVLGDVLPNFPDKVYSACIAIKAVPNFQTKPFSAAKNMLKRKNKTTKKEPPITTIKD